MSKDTPTEALYPQQMGLNMPACAPPGPTTIGRPAMILAPVPDQMRVAAFPEDLCGCCEDGETCCTAFFCPCCAHGVLCHDIEEKGYCTHCMMWCLTSSCGWVPVLLGTMARIRLRDKYGLAGDKCEDFCLHWCCQPCATAQELRFLKSLGRLNLVRDGPGYQRLPYAHAAAAPSPVGTHFRV